MINIEDKYIRRIDLFEVMIIEIGDRFFIALF